MVEHERREEMGRRRRKEEGEWSWRREKAVKALESWLEVERLAMASMREGTEVVC